MKTQVVVRNTTPVRQQVGSFVIPPGGTERIPVSMVGMFGNAVEVVGAPVEQGVITIYRAHCKEGCGHSLCTLTRKATAALERMGVKVERFPWRVNHDQAPIGKCLLCNAGTFAGPNGSWAWLHFDNSIAPRRHVEYFLNHWEGSICVSGHVREGLMASGVPPARLSVVPNAIDTEVFRPDGAAMDIGGNKFMFVTLGAMSPRKGLDAGLEAYGEAFTARDNVLLFVKNYDYGRDAWCKELIEDWKKRLGRNAPEVRYSYQRGVGNNEPPWTNEQIASLYRRAAKHGAYLMPSRVEGFGLTGLEALACGCRLGVTGWSGQLEYAHEGNSTLFGYQLQPSECNLDLYEADEKPQWAEPSRADMVAWMRRMVEEPVNPVKQQEIAADVRHRYTFEKMALGLARSLGVEVATGARQPVPPGAPLATPPRTITKPETLGIGIPTRDRPGYLTALLTALLVQTKRPDAICLVDDSDHPLMKRGDVEALKHIIERLRSDNIRVDIVKGPRKGQAFSHQIAAERLGTDLVLRMDDDLIPAIPDFVERLYRLVNQQAEVGAAGGVYPMHNDGALHAWVDEQNQAGMTNRLDDLLSGSSQLQFRRYRDAALVEAEHLYSSWIYRRQYLMEVGGFPTCYSRLQFREETDASARLHLLGKHKLLVDTQALAWHYAATGGQRSEVKRDRVAADDKLFRERVKEWRNRE